MSEETKKLRLVEKLKALGVDAPTGASVEDLTKLLEETKAAKKAEKAAKKNGAANSQDQASANSQNGQGEDPAPDNSQAGKPEDAAKPNDAGSKDQDSSEKSKGEVKVLVEEKGKFRLFSQAGEFFVLDLYERKIACGIKSADEGHKLLLDLNRK